MAVTRSPSALPSPASDAVLPNPRTALFTSDIPHVDTVSSPSLTDSSTTTDENTSPIEDVLDACLTRLASGQWMNDTAVWAWDTLGQLEHGDPAVPQLLFNFEDPEIWGLIETMVRLLLRIFAVRTPHQPHYSLSSCCRSRTSPFMALSLLPDPFLQDS